MPPAQSAQIDFHCVFGTSSIVTFTVYTDEPLTIAVTSRGAICRSTTEPLRT